MKTHYYRGDHKMRAAAIEKFIEQPYAYGLDREHGGLFYFLDVSGHSPTQLEWGMKLWWVHCEAMVASLLAYQHTREPRHWQMFHEICQYTLSKVLGIASFPHHLSRPSQVLVIYQKLVLCIVRVRLQWTHTVAILGVGEDCLRMSIHSSSFQIPSMENGTATSQGKARRIKHSREGLSKVR